MSSVAEMIISEFAGEILGISEKCPQCPAQAGYVKTVQSGNVFKCDEHGRFTLPFYE